MKYELIVRKINADTIRSLKLLTKEELKLVLFLLIMDIAAILGTVFALITFYQPLLKDLYNCDIRDPFDLEQGWLVWAIIGVIAIFGATLATKYFSKRWPQPKFKLTKDSADTWNNLDQLYGSPKVGILMWLVMVALLLPPLVEEYVYGGYLMASLTKWLATTIIVVISSLAIAFAQWNLEQLSLLFVGVLALGFTYVKTRNLMTSLAMHLLLGIVQCFVTFITFIRQSFSPGIVPLHPAKKVSYRARRKNKLVGKQ